MGLDITAYKNVELIGSATCWDEWAERQDRYTTAFIIPDQDFPERLPPILPGGVYKAESNFSFSAGNYSDYNSWRARLCQMALGVDITLVWDNESLYIGKPFSELICFSDCKGVLGTDVCKKLLGDFEEWQEQADKIGGHFAKLYNGWRKALEYAANGYISFH